MDAPTAADLAAGFAQTAYRWPLRRYQRLAIEAFERERAAGRTRCYLVLPPGAGKTVLGLEIARRRGERALVLCPNTAVQAQWLAQWDDFQPARVPASAEADGAAPLTVLTYQALCSFGGDEALDEQALALWQAALAAEQGLAPAAAAARIADWASAAPRLYRAELARYRGRARRLIARGGDRAQLLALLHPNGRALVARLKAAGTRTLVLDECHHLLEMWGYLVRALVEELGDVFVLGLTATPPADMDAREWALYRDVFDDADFEVPTPAVVKEGDLAPYQELAYLTTPLPHEQDYVAAQHARFQALLGRLLVADSPRGFVAWLQQRIAQRRARNGAELSWERFERDHPALAQAALRVFHQHDLALPGGARLRERHRVAPTADDWVLLIEDYCLGYLQTSADPRDEALREEIRRALPALGYVLTRQGIRAHVSPVDRVLALSASKAAAALAILGIEQQVLGPRMRALVLCDYERAGREVVARLRGVLDPQAGSAALLLHLLLADAEVARLEPILITGRTVACARATAAPLAAWLAEQAPALGGRLALTRLFASDGEDGTATWDDVVALAADHAGWQPRQYVPLLTRYYEAGRSRCLVGTRALMGEGWDARGVNVLIDLTAASTSTAVHQMRGRSLRLDPMLPRKVADNWDVVCVAPDHPKGAADYARFVRKHQHYYAPTAEGAIESGVSHVHPSLSPYGPPTADAFAAINAALLARARDRDAAYDRWAVGTPYANREIHTVRLRFARSLGLPGRRLLRAAPAAPPGGLGLRPLAELAATVLGSSAVASAAGPEAGVLAGGLGAVGLTSLWSVRAVGARVQRLGPSDALEDLAAAVAAALAATGGIAATLGPAAVRVAVERDGYYRCYLEGGSPEDSGLFADALDELLAPLDAPRYLIPRYVTDAPDSALATAALLLRQTLRGGVGSRVVYHAVPAYLAANRARVQAFRAAWHRHVSAGEPLYAQDPRAQAILAVQRGADPFAVTSQMRALWR
jgi:superfamily II DNA or RNA helicase